MKHPITIALAIIFNIHSYGIEHSKGLYSIDDPTDCTIEVEIPDNFHVCFDETFNLGGVINGDYEEFEWLENGSSTNHSLNEEVEIDQTTTFTLIAWGSSGENIIENGDFEDGASGFTTDYELGSFSCFGLGFLDCEGTYGVIDDPSLGHANFAACSDVEGGGNMMVVNGASSLQEIWCQEVCVEVGANYLFNAWATSVNAASPAQLQFSIDGNLIGNLFSLTSNLCDWEEFEAEWGSDASTTIEICVTNQNTAASGNDFALDNIGFYQVCQDEASFTVSHSEFEVDLLGIELLNCIVIETEGLFVIDPPGIYDIELSFEGTVIESSSTDEFYFTLDTPGEYHFEVTDEWGCSLIYEFDVEAEYNYPEPELASSNDLNCEQLSSQLTADSNLRGTLFEWFNDQNIPIGDDEEITVTQGGFYYLLATDDDSGCQTLDSIFLDEDFTVSDFFILGGDPLTCINTESTLYTSIESDSVHWIYHAGNDPISNNDTLLISQSGNYSASVVLENGCIAKDTITVDEIAINFDFSVSYDSLINCLDSFSLVQLNYDSSFYQLNWLNLNESYNDSTEFILSNAGSYYYSLLNLEGCIMIDSLTIEADFDFVVPDLIADSIDCTGEQAFISIVDSLNEYNIEWLFEDGNIVTSDSALINSVGIIEYDMSYINGCEMSGQEEIFSSENIPEISIKGDTINCTNAFVELIPVSNQNKLSYLWTLPNGAQLTKDTITVMQNGLYLLQVTNNLSCQNLKEYFLEIDTIRPSIEIPSDITLDCAQSTFSSELIITSSYEQVLSNNNWLNGNNLNYEISESGVYEFEVIAKNGCSVSSSFEAVVDTITPVLNIPDSVNLNCAVTVDTIYLNSNPEDVLVWTYNNINHYSDTIVIVDSGIYTIEITGSNACVTSGEIISYSDFEKPEYSLSADTISCDNLESTISISGDENEWENISIFKDDILVAESNRYVSEDPGLFTVIVTALNGCSHESEVTIAIDTSTIQFTLESDMLDCLNNEIQIRIIENLNTSNAQVYNSNGLLLGNLDISISEPDEYSVTVLNENGCPSTKKVLIVEDIDPPVITSLEYEDIVCSESIELSILEILDISQLSQLNIDQSPINPASIPITINGPGDHTIELIGNNGCITDTIITIAPLEEIDGYIFPELKLFEGEEQELQIEINKSLDEIESISWYPENGLSCYDCLNPNFIGLEDQEYTITLVDINGCEDELELRVMIEKNIKYYIPNVINQSDSRNAFFTIFSKENDIQNINSLSIYDRWGNLMFIKENMPANNPQEGWDGTYHDKYVEQGVYVFVAELLLRNKEVKVISGDVTVLR